MRSLAGSGWLGVVALRRSGVARLPRRDVVSVLVFGCFTLRKRESRACSARLRQERFKHRVRPPPTPSYAAYIGGTFSKVVASFRCDTYVCTRTKHLRVCFGKVLGLRR